MGVLDDKHLFLAVLEAGKSKIKVLADLVSGKSPHPGLQMGTFFFFFFFFFFFLVFLPFIGPFLRHMEVPRLGV